MLLCALLCTYILHVSRDECELCCHAMLPFKSFWALQLLAAGGPSFSAALLLADLHRSHRRRRFVLRPLVSKAGHDSLVGGSRPAACLPGRLELVLDEGGEAGCLPGLHATTHSAHRCGGSQLSYGWLICCPHKLHLQGCITA